jgi:signal transduction histidine kinase
MTDQINFLTSKTIMDASSNGIILFNGDKTVTYSNFAATNFTKLPSSGYNISEIFKLFPEVDFLKTFEQVNAQKTTYRIAEVKSRDYFYEIFLIPLINDEDKIVGGSVLLHDITYIKSLEEIKAQFLTVAAHQLRTPLGGMRWSLEMIIEEIKDQVSPEIKSLLNQVYQSNLMSLSIINDLLNVSKIDGKQALENPEPTNIIRIIQKVLSNHRNEAELKSVQYKVNLPPAETFPSIIIDKVKIKQVIDNLIANAIKYNKPNGSLSVTIGQDGKTMTLTVADTGIGIPEKDSKRIFTKFFRANNAVLNETTGSGLGLFVVKSYVESWGGKISFNSQENVGTSVTITIPITISAEQDAQNLVI